MRPFSLPRQILSIFIETIAAVDRLTIRKVNPMRLSFSIVAFLVALGTLAPVAHAVSYGMYVPPSEPPADHEWRHGNEHGNGHGNWHGQEHSNGHGKDQHHHEQMVKDIYGRPFPAS